MRIGPIALAAALFLLGCDEPETISPPPPVRAIKYMTLSLADGGQVRRISGVFQAETSTEAAFQTAGQVTALLKNVGDRVQKGEAIAKLDPEPLRLRLASARSELAQAEASVADAKSKFEQQKHLYERGYATRTNFDSASASLKTAEGAVGVTRSQYRIARRDLEKATLKAPFAGVVAKRAVDAFEEVASGQTIYVIQSEGGLEVRVSLPETLITTVKVGDLVRVYASLIRPEPFGGVVEETAPLAEGANAYPVTIRLTDASPAMRPGMSAEVAFEFPGEEANYDAYAVPIAAVKPNAGQEGGTVFRFADGKIEALDIQVANVRDNMLLIVGGLAPGDIIATAGVNELYDGMPARLLDPAALR